MIFFFFSSRRRHTRYWRDWSSDVCSSDLIRPKTRRTTSSRSRQPSGSPYRNNYPDTNFIRRRLTLMSCPLSRPKNRCHRSEEHTSELQSRQYLVCRLLLEKKKRPYLVFRLLLETP